MPYPNEHALRMRDPGDFDPDSFRRTHGSGDGMVHGVKIPETIDVIWGKLKGASGESDPPVAQALRFPTASWTEAEAKAWISENEILGSLEPASDGKAGARPGLLRRSLLTVQTRVADAAKRVLEFVASTPSVDRMNDSIEPAGWELERFRRQGVILWNHDDRVPAIGRPVSAESDAAALRVAAEFAGEAQGHDLAETVFRLYRDGFLKACSVGFLPLEWEPLPSKTETTSPGMGVGLRYLRQELLELSACNVGANQDGILAGAKAARFDAGERVALVRLGLLGRDRLDLDRWQRAEGGSSEVVARVRGHLTAALEELQGLDSDDVEGQDDGEDTRPDAEAAAADGKGRRLGARAHTISEAASVTAAVRAAIAEGLADRR